MRYLAVLLSTLALLHSQHLFGESPARLSGYWVMPDGAAVVEVGRAPDASDWQVQIIALRDPWFTEADENSKTGAPRTDIHHPDPELRARSLLNLTIGEGFEYNEGRLIRGKIYDPGSGKHYRAEMQLTDGGLLRVRGYIGIAAFGRTMYWHPLDEYRRRSIEMFKATSVIRANP